MSTVGQIERETQDRVVKLFRNTLRYDYLGNWEEREDNCNIEGAYLRPFLQEQGYSDTLINRALYELTRWRVTRPRACMTSTKRCTAFSATA